MGINLGQYRRPGIGPSIGPRGGPSVERRRLQLRERERLIRSIANHMASAAHGPMGIFLDIHKDIYDLVRAKQAWGLWDPKGRGFAVPIEWTRPYK